MLILASPSDHQTRMIQMGLELCEEDDVLLTDAEERLKKSVKVGGKGYQLH